METTLKTTWQTHICHGNHSQHLSIMSACFATQVPLVAFSLESVNQLVSFLYHVFSVSHNSLYQICVMLVNLLIMPCSPQCPVPLEMNACLALSPPHTHLSPFFQLLSTGFQHYSSNAVPLYHPTRSHLFYSLLFLDKSGGSDCLLCFKYP